MASEGGFKANFTAEGLATLKARIEEKLKEFMGDYTDDTLVEYVIVMLRNGRRKAEAAQELHVFLGDDNLSFISWLWDHLSSNLQLYVQPPSPPAPAPAPAPINAASSSKRQRQKIEWDEDRRTKQPRLQFPLRSVITSVLNPPDKAADRPPPPASAPASTSTPRSHRSRRLPQEQNLKPRLAVDAPRRLLQFAVRDAVNPMHRVNRLRYVLSAPPSQSLQGRDQFRELEEEDELQGRDQFRQAEEEDEFREEQEEDEQEDKYSMSPSLHPAHRARPGTALPGGSSRPDRSSVFNRLGQARGTLRISHAEIKDKYSSDSGSGKHSYDMVEHSVAQPQEEEAEVESQGVPTVPASHIESGPSKILNISVNVNTWKSPGMVQETHSFSLQNNKMSKAENAEVALPAMVQRALPKTPLPVASQSLEDPDSRTLFVSNVHFGATKDALSRHFNKFGAVLKVIILADVNTGRPTGSAYIEFLQKESVEAALSLNGIPFMSRILKVARKNSQESGPTVTSWGPSRGAHVPSFPSRFVVRPQYVAWGRAPVRGGGGRSLQWKRGGPSSDTTLAGDNGAVGVRNFTYTRVPSNAPA